MADLPGRVLMLSLTDVDMNVPGLIQLGRNLVGTRVAIGSCFGCERRPNVRVPRFRER